LRERACGEVSVVLESVRKVELLRNERGRRTIWGNDNPVPHTGSNLSDNLVPGCEGQGIRSSKLE